MAGFSASKGHPRPRAPSFSGGTRERPAMPFANGSYTGLGNTFNDAAAGQVIDPEDWNDLFTDMEAALNVLSKGTHAATTDVVSAATTNIGAAATSVVRITGSTGP